MRSPVRGHTGEFPRVTPRKNDENSSEQIPLFGAGYNPNARRDTKPFVDANPPLIVDTLSQGSDSGLSFSTSTPTRGKNITPTPPTTKLSLGTPPVRATNVESLSGSIAPLTPSALAMVMDPGSPLRRSVQFGPSSPQGNGGCFPDGTPEAGSYIVPKNVDEYTDRLIADTVRISENGHFHENTLWLKLQALFMTPNTPETSGLSNRIRTVFNWYNNTVSFNYTDDNGYERVLHCQRLKPHECDIFRNLFNRDEKSLGASSCSAYELMIKVNSIFSVPENADLLDAESDVKAFWFNEEMIFTDIRSGRVMEVLVWPTTPILNAVSGASKQVEKTDLKHESALTLTRTPKGQSNVELAELDGSHRRSLKADKIREFKMLFNASIAVWKIGAHSWITQMALLLTRSHNIEDYRDVLRALRILHLCLRNHGDMKAENACLTKDTQISSGDISNMGVDYKFKIIQSVPRLDDFESLDIILYHNATSKVNKLYTKNDAGVVEIDCKNNKPLLDKLNNVSEEVELRNLIFSHEKFLVGKGLTLNGKSKGKVLDWWDNNEVTKEIGEDELKRFFQSPTPDHLPVMLWSEALKALNEKNGPKVVALSHVRDNFAAALTMLEVYGNKYKGNKMLVNPSAKTLIDMAIPVGLPIFTVSEYHEMAKDEASVFESYKVPSCDMKICKSVFDKESKAERALRKNKEINFAISVNDDGKIKVHYKDKWSLYNDDLEIKMYELTAEQAATLIGRVAEKAKTIEGEIEDEDLLIADSIRDSVLAGELEFIDSCFNPAPIESFDIEVRKIHGFVERNIKEEWRPAFLLLLSKPLEYYHQYCCNETVLKDGKVTYIPKAVEDTPSLEDMVAWPSDRAMAKKVASKVTSGGAGHEAVTYLRAQKEALIKELRQELAEKLHNPQLQQASGAGVAAIRHLNANVEVKDFRVDKWSVQEVEYASKITNDKTLLAYANHLLSKMSPDMA